MLAVQVPEGTVFYRADERSDELGRLAVVVGTVREQGAGRWNTADGTPPASGDGIYYVPLRLEQVRVLQGVVLIADGALDLRQFVAPPGAGSNDEARATFGELTPLQRGDTVLAFLWMGANPPPKGTPGAAATPWFHWTTPNRLYRLRDGLVAPLGIPADAGAPGMPEGAFLAGIAEAFRGVTALDPRAPTAPILPAPTALPLPGIEAGDTANLAQRLGLMRTEWVAVSRYADPRDRYPIVEAGRIAAIVAALDRPLTVEAILPQKSADDARTTVIVNFNFPFPDTVVLEYDTAAGRIVTRDNFSRRASFPAPPGFARLLGLE